MQLIDLIYQCFKSSVWRDREISKEKIANQEYLVDSELSTVAYNIYAALNDAFSLCYILNKVEPVVITQDKTEDNEYFLGDDIEEVLSAYTKEDNKYKTYDFDIGATNGSIILHNVDTDKTSISFEVIKRIPQVENIHNEIDLSTYGINNNIAISCSNYVSALLYDGIDTNWSYYKQQGAMSVINALPTYGNRRIHIQQKIEDTF